MNAVPQNFDRRDEPLDVDRLMREIRAEVGARLDGADEPDDAEDGGDGRGAFAANALPPLGRIGEFSAPLASKPRYRLDDFLAFHDEDFIRNAYRALLGREPDPEGASRYLARIRAGELSRIEVLGRIRYSPEGKAAGVSVDGLAVPFGWRTARRVPLLGRLLGILQYAWRLPDLARRHEMLEAAVFANRSDMRSRVNAIVGDVERALAATGGARAAHESALTARIDAAQAASAQLSRRIEAVLATVDGKAERSALESGLLDLRGAIDRVKDTANENALATAQALHERIAQAESGLRGVLGAPVDDAFYATFEDRFRGTREDIRQRVEVYLPYVRAAGAGSAQAPLLDVGCGRGEWIELLGEQGLVAAGVDVNDVAVAGCRARGLDVVRADAIGHLRSLPAGALGAVSALHVIEHLPFARIVELFDEAHRALRPGGVVIFETPNPENLVVGACGFYYDPTHLRPLPPEPFRFVLEQRGFARVEILRLHPDTPAPDGGAPGPLGQVIAERLYGPRDYALVGFKP